MSTEVKEVQVTLSQEERQQLAEYDSRLFGFLKLDGTDGPPRKTMLEKGVAYYEQIIRSHIKQNLLTESNDENKEKKIEPFIFCHLGHLLLLLEQFPKAMSAYQKFYQLQTEHWKDAPFLYGLGLVYFHFNAFQLCTRAFQQVLYIDPGFVRANEVHIRLGLVYKAASNYEASIKHFRLAVSDSSECTLSKAQIRLHIAHLLEVQGKHKQAKEAYEQFLQIEGTEKTVQATALKQIGWLYHSVESLGEKNNRENLAIHYLQKAVEADPTNGQTWYLLGRCFSSIGKVHDAFVSYRSSIDKSEANADTWCSIGVLYQQQNQPMDGLQAYICAVQLDKFHTAAWTNLGILYETCSQPKDALNCYVNATRSKGGVNPSISAKIKLIKQHMNEVPPQHIQNKPKTLPSIEEAWSLPIPAELTSRQGTGVTNPQHLQKSTMMHSQPVVTPHISTPGQPTVQLQPGNQPEEGKGKKKKSRKRASTEAPEPPTPPPPPQFLTPQQMQLMHHLQQNQGNLNSQQQQLLQNFQRQYFIQQQYQHKMQAMQQEGAMRHMGINQQVRMPGSSPNQQPGGIFDPRFSPPGQLPTGSFRSQTKVSPQQGPMRPVQPGVGQDHFLDMPNGMPFRLPASLPQSGNIPAQPSLSQGPGCLSSLAQSPLKQTSSHPTGTILQSSIGDSINPLLNSPTGSKSSFSSSHPLPKELQHLVSSGMSRQELTTLLSRQDLTTSDTLLAQFSQSQDKKSDKPSDIYSANSSQIQAQNISAQNSGSVVHNVDIPLTSASTHLHSSILAQDSTNPSSLSSVHISNTKNCESMAICSSTSQEQPAKISISMSATEIMEASKNYGKHGVSTSMLGDRQPPRPPSPPYPHLPKEELNPPTPSVYLENKKDAFSIELQQYCHSQPVVVIRGMAGALKLDLGLFSTKSLVEANADHLVEVRTQKQQAPDENLDSYGNKVWHCNSSRSHTTVAKYAQYQASSFQESLKEENDKARGIHKESDSDSNSSTGKGKKKFKIIKFGTNVDLSDEKKWYPQLQELTKLPAFARVVSASNMVSHVGYTILGMNSVQLYMKVPGSRTPGHQENINFCSININIGPGDCEWFAVPEHYWGVIYNLCEKNNLDYLTGSWWPVLEDMYEENVPVYRFIQKPGDLVWVGAGAVHWVQAIGWCNNIAWNVGPLTTHQYQLGLERYEWNKLQCYKSIVPMIHLSWNLARNMKISDPKLFECIKSCLAYSLRQVQYTLNFTEYLGLGMKWHGHTENEASQYCNNCEVEVFNILFVMEQDKKFVVYCIDCAKKINSRLEGFVILKQYRRTELMQVYDNFHLHTQNSLTN